MSAALSFDDEVDDQVAAAVADVARAVFAGHAATPRTDLLGALGKSGLLGLGVPQDQGGSGGSALLAALVAEQAGVALTAPDVLHQWVGVVALAAAGADVEDIAGASTGTLPIMVGFTAATASEVSVPFVVDADLLLLCTDSGLVTSPESRSIQPGAPRIAGTLQTGGRRPSPCLRRHRRCRGRQGRIVMSATLRVRSPRCT